MKRAILTTLSISSLLLLVCLNLSYFQLQPLVWFSFFAFMLTFVLAGKGFGYIIADFTDNEDHQGLGIPLFFLFSALTTWLVNIVFMGSSSLVLIIFTLASISYLGIKVVTDGLKFKEKVIDDLINQNVGIILFLIFLLITSFHLALATGEKPMDFGILNYFYMHESGRPTDIWASGSGFSYYYLGYLSWAKWLKLFEIGTDYGFPLVFAMNVWMFFHSLSAFFKIVFKKSVCQAILLSLFVLMIPSFQVFRQLVMGEKWNFSFYWKSTRVFQENLFSEFPIWSFSFGDLHPHVMNYPFVIAFLALLLSYRNFSKIDLKHLVFVVLTGVSLSMVNIWEGIFLSGFCFIFYLWSWKDTRKRLDIRETYQRMVLAPILSILLGVIVIMPWLKSLVVHSGSAGHFARSLAPSNGISEYFMLYGSLDLIYFFSMVILFFKKEIVLRREDIVSRLKLLLLYVPAFVLGMINPAVNAKIFSVIMLIGVLLSFLLIVQEKEKYVFTGLLTFAGLCVVHYSENIILLDRINSLFKTNTFVYVLFAVSAAVLLFEALETLSMKWSGAIYGLVLVLFSFTTFVLVSSIHTIAGPAGIRLDNPLEHLRKKSPGDAKVVEWLRKNAKATDIVLEYFGAPYKYTASRISTYSGVPSFLGWAGQHVTQRGLSHQELERRRKLIKKIYSSIEAEESHQVLVREGIDYVVTGSFESSNVSLPGLEKFDKAPDKFEKSVHDLPTGIRLYKVLR